MDLFKHKELRIESLHEPEFPAVHLDPQARLATLLRMVLNKS